MPNLNQLYVKVACLIHREKCLASRKKGLNFRIFSLRRRSLMFLFIFIKQNGSMGKCWICKFQ